MARRSVIDVVVVAVTVMLFISVAMLAWLSNTDVCEGQVILDGKPYICTNRGDDALHCYPSDCPGQEDER
jgi:hypothetical protein